MLQSPHKLRDLFAIMWPMCCVIDPVHLMMHHRENLTEGIKHCHFAQLQFPRVELAFTDEMFNMAVIVIEDKVMELGGRELASFDLSRMIHIQSANVLSCGTSMCVHLLGNPTGDQFPKQLLQLGNGLV